MGSSPSVEYHPEQLPSLRIASYRKSADPESRSFSLFVAPVEDPKPLRNQPKFGRIFSIRDKVYQEEVANYEGQESSEKNVKTACPDTVKFKCEWIIEYDSIIAVSVFTCPGAQLV